MANINEILAQGIREMKKRIDENPDNISRSHEMRIRKENVRSTEAQYAIVLAKDLKERDELHGTNTVLREMTPELDGIEYVEGLKFIVTVDKETDMTKLLGFLDSYDLYYKSAHS